MRHSCRGLRQTRNLVSTHNIRKSVVAGTFGCVGLGHDRRPHRPSAVVGTCCEWPQKPAANLSQLNVLGHATVTANSLKVTWVYDSTCLDSRHFSNPSIRRFHPERQIRLKFHWWPRMRKATGRWQSNLSRRHVTSSWFHFRMDCGSAHLKAGVAASSHNSVRVKESCRRILAVEVRSPTVRTGTWCDGLDPTRSRQSTSMPECL